MTDEKKTTARGGRREGAGRPASDSKLYAFRAPKKMADYIDAQDNKTEFIKECIASTMEMQQEVRVPTFGEVYPATRVKPMTLPLFDIKIVAGFPIPLDNDELAQDIELLRMLCPHPEASYLIRVTGNSMIEAGIRALGETLGKYKQIQRVEILPYHRFGVHKWEAMGWKYELDHVKENTQEQLQRAESLFKEYFPTVIVN